MIKSGFFLPSWMVILLIWGCLHGCTVLSTAKHGLDPNASGNEKGTAPRYYDFDDVLVPNELKVQNNRTFVFRTPGLTAGVLSFTGRVERNSLITFFEHSMAADRWKPVGSFKSPRSILLYQKTNRWCVISITENDFTTDVDIWVGPNPEEQQNQPGK